jgi:hypothetical protein
MTRRKTAAVLAGVAAIITSSVVFGRQPAQQANAPGFPTEARVVVGNSQTDPVPVVLAAAGQLQPVAIVGTPVVSLVDGSPVTTRAGSQRWEYRSVVVPVDADPALTLAAPGQEGWEAVSAVLTTGGALRVLLKRPS